ncbi:hypothetical protein C1H87_15810 [Flavivirga eckloniae]|uniref:Uncharacterized protein n=2 Tax=Flavivirga eckloniae TaxID=1803846 RepID=A0A2K9PSP2_9FLAO|nr:hypothetical protein C1H87_15810 [Flavivirga eckloniae]
MFLFLSWSCIGQNISRDKLAIDGTVNNHLFFKKGKYNLNKITKEKLECFLTHITNKDVKTEKINFIVHRHSSKEKRTKVYSKAKDEVLKYLFSKDISLLDIEHKSFYGRKSKRKNEKNWYFEIQLYYRVKDKNGEMVNAMYDFNKCKEFKLYED